ncbi:hypothetical protein OSTOST_02892 [Ostertagia ostertagi]
MLCELCLALAVLEKVDRIGWSLLDDGLFYDDSSLDKEFARYTALPELPFLVMVERIIHMEKEEKFMRLVKFSDVKKVLKKFSYVGYQINAQYRSSLNHLISRELGHVAHVGGHHGITLAGLMSFHDSHGISSCSPDVPIYAYPGVNSGLSSATVTYNFAERNRQLTIDHEKDLLEFYLLMCVT